jgi:hypothetical protein
MNYNDYDEDGNNIVPCPICLNEHCPSKEEGGKCPEEDEFVKSMHIKGDSIDEAIHLSFLRDMPALLTDKLTADDLMIIENWARGLYQDGWNACKILLVKKPS